MKILLFGALAEAVGKSTFETDFVIDTDELTEKIFSKFPELKNYQFSIAVNKVKIDNKTILNKADEIALLPAFAGG